MRLPRDVSGADLVQALRRLGYEVTRQHGSHLRLTTGVNGTHHVTVPQHRPLKTGTLLGGVLRPVAHHHGLTVADLVRKLGL